MENLGAKFDNLYRKVGEKNVLLIVFFTGVFVHTFFALKMEMISVDPNEFGVMAWTAMFGGRNWSGIMSQIDYYYGYAGAVLYTPLFLVIKNPFVFYKAVLILNGIIVSFVPIIAFRIGALLGMDKSWNRILVALVCGIYSTAFAHTKFAWNETACVIVPWIIIYLVLKADGIKAKSKKALISILIAFCTVVAYAAHPRLFSVSVAIVLVIIFAAVFMKRKLLNLYVYFPALCIFGAAEMFLQNFLLDLMWGEERGVLHNTPGSFINSLGRLSSSDGLSRFSAAFFGHLYYLITSTWGLGSLAICIATAAVIGACLKKKDESKFQSKDEYTHQFVLFALFALASNAIALVVSVLEKSSGEGLRQYQDTVIFGRYMDSIIPLLIMLVISYVFIYSLDIMRLLASFLLSGVIYTLFFIFTEPIIRTAGSVRVSPILGLYPVRIGENIDAIIDFDGLLLTVSCVFCFAALFTVIVCCSKRYRRHIISMCMVLTMLYSSLYTATIYLPFAASEAAEVNSHVYELSEYVFNAPDAPYVYTYKVTRRTATLLQFLNRDTRVYSVPKLGDLPENCFIIVPDNERIALKPDSEQLFRELARTPEYTLYAYGEKANAYAQSQETEN